MWFNILCFMVGGWFGLFISSIMVASRRRADLAGALDEVRREDYCDYMRDARTGDQPAA
jgi:hypothetical protein